VRGEVIGKRRDGLGALAVRREDNAGLVDVNEQRDVYPDSAEIRKNRLPTAVEAILLDR